MVSRCEAKCFVVECKYNVLIFNAKKTQHAPILFVALLKLR